jgi:hypothetical protein
MGMVLLYPAYTLPIAILIHAQQPKAKFNRKIGHDESNTWSLKKIKPKIHSCFGAFCLYVNVL